MKKLNRRKRLWRKYYLDENSKKTFHNGSKSAIAAGYEKKYSRTVGSLILKELRESSRLIWDEEDVKALEEEEGLSDAARERLAEKREEEKKREEKEKAEREKYQITREAKAEIAWKNYLEAKTLPDKKFWFKTHGDLMGDYGVKAGSENEITKQQLKILEGIAEKVFKKMYKK